MLSSKVGDQMACFVFCEHIKQLHGKSLGSIDLGGVFLKMKCVT